MSFSRSGGISRAELTRRLVSRGMSEGGWADRGIDLAAIEDSFGVLEDQTVAHDPYVERGDDNRARHLDRVGRR